MSKASREDMEKMMAAKIMAIPTPKISVNQRQKMIVQNRDQDKKNYERTLKILHDRREEAIESGDQQKKYAAIAIERDERDKFSLRTKIQELELKASTMRRIFEDETWNLLEQFSDLKDDKYWKKAKEKGGFSDSEIALYYRDVWGIQPKQVVKFLEIIKIRNEIRKLEKLNR